MKVELKANTEKIFKELDRDFYSTYVWDKNHGESNPEYGVDGFLDDVIDAVLQHVTVKVDGSTALVVVK